MRLVGLPVRPGRGSAPVAIEPSEKELGGATAMIAVLPEVLPDDRRLRGRAGWVGITTESTLAGAHLSATPGPPIVGGIDVDVLRAGERVSVDGAEGAVELPGVTEVNVVTSFLERADGRVLLLRRSEKVGSFRGRWAGVSGFVEDATPEAQARREILEETAIDPALPRLVAAGAPIYARDGQTVFTVHPFRLRVGDVSIRLDWEHTEYEWVRPEEIGRRETVPKLERVWRSVSRIA